MQTALIKSTVPGATISSYDVCLLIRCKLFLLQREGTRRRDIKVNRGTDKNVMIVHVGESRSGQVSVRTELILIHDHT